MSSELVDLLRQIDSTGPEGFEGLVARLLTALTGRHFYLARAGFQAGLDASTRSANSNVIAVECKRYGQDREFDERELLGEMAQAVMGIPDLDLWVLVASRDVPSQLQQVLHKQAHDDGLEFLSISANDDEPSSLEILCAQAPEIVLSYLGGQSAPTEEKIRQLLKEISESLEFDEKVEDIKKEFLSPLVGYDNWRLAQNGWFQNCLASETESRAHFCQPLNIKELGTTLVHRELAWAKFDEWFSNWNETQKPFVLLGEEGDGKTWAVASWLDQKIQDREDFPAVAFLSSSKVDSNEPLSLLSGIISRRLPMLQEDDWARRLDRWTRRSVENAPSLLLVLDGINERRKATWWRGLLEQLAASPWRDSVAVLITCRTAYWHRYLEPLRHLHAVTYTLPPYSDDELDTALAHHDLSRSDIPGALLSLIRKPRYLDLMVKHRVRMAESGDVTVARLIYEDWRDRLQRKGLELDDDGFKNLLRDLASKYLEGEERVRERDVDVLLPSYEDKQAIVEELCTGGVLQGEGGHYEVNEELLVHGFGLLLVDRINEEVTISEPDWEETIAEWLEPQAEMDIKARICEFAALHALDQPELPRKAKVALLNAWINSHNPGEETETSLVSYCPIDPASYTELAEVVWSEATDNWWAQELLLQTFLHWRDSPQVHSQLRTSFERWLGFVHLYGVSYQRGKTEEDVERLRQEICDRAGSALEVGPFTFAGRTFTAIEDDGLLRLGRAALAVISCIPRGPFVQAMATGCVAEALMGTPAKYDMFKWITSTASQSVWTEVKQEVEQLLETAHLVTKQAAHRLLSFEGSEEAYKLQRTLPDNLFPLSPFHEAYEKDPCTSLFAWTQEVCESCLQRKDLSPGHIAKRMKLHCVNPALPIPDDLGTRLEPLTREINTESLWSLMGSTGDDIAFDEYEPSLCAYAPYALADLVRRVVCQAEQRKDLSLRQLAWRLKEHSLIFGAEETNSVYRAWQGLCEIPAWNKTEESAEFFLFDSILRGLDSQGQLEHLLARPDEARDLATYEVDFLPVVDWAVVWSELGSPQNAKRRQRTLWFLSSYPNSIPKRCISENLAAFLSHEDSLVRSSVLKILYVTKDEQTIDIFIKDGWTWDRSFCDRENHWGSLLLCEHGDALTYTELRSRLHPVYLGYAIQCRGMEDSEVDQYAEDIHHLWSRIGIATPDLPSDFPPTDIETSEDITQRTRLRLSPSTLSRSITFISCDSTWGGGDRGNAADVFRSWESGDQERQNMAQIARQTIEEQIEAGNLWFAQDFRACALEQVMNRRPDLVSQWVEFALADTDDAIRRVRLARSFYEALCTMLLEHNPDTGSDLYWRLLKISGGITVRDARSEIRLLDYALFKAPANEIQNAWERRLEECTTDQELMQIAIVAQHGNGGDWLEAYIYERTQSSVPLERCRALTLLGFMETEESFELLNELLETAPATWIQDLLTTSLKRRQTNAWAKHWFQRFLTVDDDILAWAAFRLFLQCVDSRFWFWQQDVQSEVGDNAQLERRLAFLKSNSGTIEKRVRKNEKGLTENLFGQKARQNQAWPWIQIF